jgi:hypothetical protein
MKHLVDDDIDVFLPRTERRNLYPNDVEAVVEIGPKATFTQRVFERQVRCRDDSDVRRDVRRTSERTDLIRLQRLQQLRLQLERQLAYLIKKKSALVCLLEDPWAILTSVCECAAPDAEQLRLRKAGRKSGTIELHELGSSPRTSFVDEPGDGAFPDAALAGDQDRKMTLRGASGEVDRLLHGWAAHGEPSGCVSHGSFPEPNNLSTQLTLSERALHGEDENFDAERLRQEIDRTASDRLDGEIDGAERRDEQHHLIGTHVVDCAEKVDASHLRHLDVGDHQIERFAAEKFDGKTSGRFS